ncbi:glycerate kinase [Lusitaniella coriacea]|uniref:glycerate kinase n=1 Tax=Lusitaniella coriacea TaxID=1983105 RepID=UPI003CE78F83
MNVPLSLLQRWQAGNCPQPEELQQVLVEELGNRDRALAFDITPHNGLQAIERRVELLQQVGDEVLQLCQNFAFGDIDRARQTLWMLWLPLALQIADRKSRLNRPLIQGILGGQGTGKTTLAAVLRLILGKLNYSSTSISIDDLYKSYAERQELQRQDPRLIWRGPPGTHDVELGIQLLDSLRHPQPHQSIKIPRFDKSAYNGAGDRTAPELIDPVDIVFFEGWFVGVRPVDEAVFDRAPPPIITPEDRRFARDTNERLKAYLPLWQRLDRLLVLYPVDYRLSQQWRKEAEHKMKATGKTGMRDREIEQFVEYFWKALHPELFIKPLVEQPGLAECAIALRGDRTVECLYRPGLREL